MTETNLWVSKLPPPLMTSEAGSFAQATLLHRKPLIIQQVIRDNDYPRQIVNALERLQAEIGNQPMKPLVEEANDTDFWNNALREYEGRLWLDAPWYFAETFFYRRLLEAIKYFQPGPYQLKDPFFIQKQAAIRDGLEWFGREWEVLRSAHEDQIFEILFHSCLWGNRADLSNLTAQATARRGLSVYEDRRFILIDHTHSVQALLENHVKRVDFINDNAGRELFFDLALADFLIQMGWAEQVSFHLKDMPFYVSDGMIADVMSSIALLNSFDIPVVRELGKRLRKYLSDGTLRLEHEPFWTTFLMFFQMPEELCKNLSDSDLVIIKGDVNYRRLLGDLHWPFTTTMQAVAGYFPASFVVLRTLKGEILIGLQPGQAEALTSEDPTWLINGKRGVIHLFKKDSD